MLRPPGARVHLLRRGRRGGRAKLERMELAKAAKIVRDGHTETPSYFSFPEEHWARIRTNNGLERIKREIRRRTRVVGNFPDGKPRPGSGRMLAPRGAAA